MRVMRGSSGTRGELTLKDKSAHLVELALRCLILRMNVGANTARDAIVIEVRASCVLL